MKILKLTLLALAILVFAGEVWLLIHGKKALKPAEDTLNRPVLPHRHALTITDGQTVDAATAATHVNMASKAVQMIVDDARNYDERLAAVRTIITNPPSSDWIALRDYLLRKEPSDSTQSGLAFKNELLNQLGSLRPVPSELGETLVAMARSGNLDAVIRDYALQDLSAFYDELEASHRMDPQTRQVIQNTLWDGLSETDSSIAGTSLLALERLSRDRADFDRQQIASVALQFADQGDVGELTRITAFQVCARLDVADALPAVIQAAQHGATIPLQISAVSALGRLGGSDQIPFLRSLVNGAEERLQLPAKRALDQIMARSANRK